MKQKTMELRQKMQFTLLLFKNMMIMKELIMNWKQKIHYSLLLLMWRDMKVKVGKKNKNDRIDEETNEGENPDSMGHSEEKKQMSLKAKN